MDMGIESAIEDFLSWFLYCFHLYLQILSPKKLMRYMQTKTEHRCTFSKTNSTDNSNVQL